MGLLRVMTFYIIPKMANLLFLYFHIFFLQIHLINLREALPSTEHAKRSFHLERDGIF